MNAPILFLILSVGLALPIAASTFVPGAYVWAIVPPGIAVYAFGLGMDLKTTMVFGIGVVRKCETSPLFAYLCRRGFRTAIVVQVSAEGLMAVFLLPLLIIGMLSPAVTGAGLAAFGLIHYIGSRENSQTLKKGFK